MMAMLIIMAFMMAILIIMPSQHVSKTAKYPCPKGRENVRFIVTINSIKAGMALTIQANMRKSQYVITIRNIPIMRDLV